MRVASTWTIDRRDRRRQRRAAAFSVVEGLIASTVLAIAVVGIAGPLGAASQQARIVRERGAALSLARELLEEIAAKPLCDAGGACHLGPETGSGETDRSKYDSADDYNGYADSTKELWNLSHQRVAFDPTVIYTRKVAVEYRASANGAAASSGDFALVTVTVTTPHKETVKVARLLCKNSLTN
ncbi:MAG TPA: hypothetical protein VH475_02745 [Tepidisphaeraceae bacterium]|jgi:Tfp pilus assembly protein PilV